MMVLQPVHFALVFSQLGGNPQNHSLLHLVSGSDVKAQPALAQGVKLQFNLLPVWLFSTISFVWWWWCDGEGIDNDMHMYADDEKMLSASGGWVCIFVYLYICIFVYLYICIFDQKNLISIWWLGVYRAIVRLPMTSTSYVTLYLPPY